MLSSLALTIYFCANQVTPATTTVDQLFEECHAVASRLKSVDFVISLEQAGVGPRAMRVREREGRLRGDVWFGPYVPDSEGMRVQTFDGRLHMALDTTTDRSLAKSSKPLDVMLLTFFDPLCLPYSWLMKPPFSWPRAKSKALWLDCAERAKLQAPTMVAKTPCESVRIDFPTGGWQIIEIANGVRFPVRWTEYDPNGFAPTEIVVREWKEFTTADGPAILPTLVDDFSRNSVGGSVNEIKTVYRVDLATVRINPELSEDLFTISESSADEIFDKDLGEISVPAKGVIHKVKDDGTLELNAKRIPAKSSSRTLAIVGGLIVAAIAAVAIRWSSQRHMR